METFDPRGRASLDPRGLNFGFINFAKLFLNFIEDTMIFILGQVWYLVVSIPDLCTLTYFDI